MIDENKLIEEILKRVKTHRSTMEIIRDIIPLVEKQPKVAEWIPCSERLPERNEAVLCWVISTTISSGSTYIIGSCDNGFWFFQSHDIGVHSFPVKDYETVAWMPLPEPYRGDEK